MLGEERDAAHARFQTWFPWLGSLMLLAAAVLLILLIRLLLWPVRESNRPRKDVERWLAGTHAIWGQSVAEFSRMFPGRRPVPVRFGGVPRTPFPRWLTRSSLWGSVGDQQLSGIAGDGGVHEPGPRFYRLYLAARPGLAAVPLQLPAGHGHGAGRGQPQNQEFI